MSRREWKLFVEDIIESTELIEQYIEDLEFNDFSKDRKTIDAVVRNFEIIGEASKYIPDDIKGRYKDVDWIGIVGLRNKIAHEYFGISVEIVWNIVKQEMPKLIKQMKQILEGD